MFISKKKHRKTKYRKNNHRKHSFINPKIDFFKKHSKITKEKSVLQSLKNSNSSSISQFHFDDNRQNHNFSQNNHIISNNQDFIIDLTQEKFSHQNIL